MTTKNEIPRRELLRMGAAGAAAAWAATRAKLGLAAGKVPIAVQLYSVRKDCEKDLPGTLKALKGFGYEGVEFAGYYGRSAADMKKLLDDNGLKCCGTHTGLDTLEGDVPWKQVFDACETVGGTEWYIVEYEHESQPAIPAVGRCLANLRKMGK